MNRVVHVFLNTHMGLGHDGLTAYAAKHKVDLGALSQGAHVVFINRARDKVKMYSANEVVHYKRLKSGEKLRMESLQHFPKCFTAEGELNYSQALAKSFEKYLVTRRKETDSHSVL